MADCRPPRVEMTLAAAGEAETVGLHLRGEIVQRLDPLPAWNVAVDDGRLPGRYLTTKSPISRDDRSVPPPGDEPMYMSIFLPAKETSCAAAG